MGFMEHSSIWPEPGLQNEKKMFALVGEMEASQYIPEPSIDCICGFKFSTFLCHCFCVSATLKPGVRNKKMFGYIIYIYICTWIVAYPSWSWQKVLKANRMSETTTVLAALSFRKIFNGALLMPARLQPTHVRELVRSLPEFLHDAPKISRMAKDGKGLTHHGNPSCVPGISVPFMLDNFRGGKMFFFEWYFNCIYDCIYAQIKRI